MNTVTTLPFPEPPDENELARRLLDCLRRCDEGGIAEAQGMILGLHFEKLKVFVAASMAGLPAAQVEEVFGVAAEKMYLTLFEPSRVTKVTGGGSFSTLFFTIASREVINYWRGRPPYGARKETLVDPGRSADLEGARRPERQSVDEEFADLAEILGRLRGFDALLLMLTAVEELTLRQVEHLLEIAAYSHGPAAVARAVELLDVHPILAEQYLLLVRECSTAHPMSYEALKVALHRARRRGQDELGDA